jgi:hypothetical protein
MLGKTKLCSLILASAFLFLQPAGNAFAIPLQVARKCNALTTKAFPPIVPGNPAAGRKGGNGRKVQAYFRKCVAKYSHPHKHHSQS